MPGLASGASVLAGAPGAAVSAGACATGALPLGALLPPDMATASAPQASSSTAAPMMMLRLVMMSVSPFCKLEPAFYHQPAGESSLIYARYPVRVAEATMSVQLAALGQRTPLPMPVRYHPTGVVTRDRIMREVRRSEAAGEPPLTARELARRLRLSSHTDSRP